jgi:hypothetical protein
MPPLQIVVLDRGFVYVGRCEKDKNDPDLYVIKNAKNIRQWGTSKGLGQLALEGPQKQTVLDEVGTVRFHHKALISFIDTEEKLWPQFKK